MQGRPGFESWVMPSSCPPISKWEVKREVKATWKGTSHPTPHQRAWSSIFSLAYATHYTLFDHTMSLVQEIYISTMQIPNVCNQIWDRYLLHKYILFAMQYILFTYLELNLLWLYWLPFIFSLHCTKSADWTSVWFIFGFHLNMSFYIDIEIIEKMMVTKLVITK